MYDCEMKRNVKCDCVMIIWDVICECEIYVWIWYEWNKMKMRNVIAWDVWYDQQMGIYIDMIW